MDLDPRYGEADIDMYKARDGDRIELAKIAEESMKNRGFHSTEMPDADWKRAEEMLEASLAVGGRSSGARPLSADAAERPYM